MIKDSYELRFSGVERSRVITSGERRRPRAGSLHERWCPAGGNVGVQAASDWRRSAAAAASSCRHPPRLCERWCPAGGNVGVQAASDDDVVDDGEMGPGGRARREATSSGGRMFRGEDHGRRQLCHDRGHGRDRRADQWKERSWEVKP
nr:unnamed protein product [Digitaria exilis]